MRVYIDDIKEPANMVTVYRSNIDNNFEDTEIPTVDIKDVFFLNEYVKRIRISDYLLSEYSKLILELRGQGVRVSTRRQVMLLRAVQGEALLNRRGEAVLEDFKVIRNGL